MNVLMRNDPIIQLLSTTFPQLGCSDADDKCTILPDILETFD